MLHHIMDGPRDSPSDHISATWNSSMDGWILTHHSSHTFYFTLSQVQNIIHIQFNILQKTNHNTIWGKSLNIFDTFTLNSAWNLNYHNYLCKEHRSLLFLNKNCLAREHLSKTSTCDSLVTKYIGKISTIFISWVLKPYWNVVFIKG